MGRRRLEKSPERSDSLAGHTPPATGAGYDETDYVVHRVDEKDVTIDWFFGHGRPGTKARQLVLIVVGWFFTVLPVVITASALLHRDADEGEGWWGYHEGFAMWDQTIRFLGFLTAFFAVAFMVLYLLNRASSEGTQPAHDLTTRSASRSA